jgi:hypothetical protein
MLCSLAKIISVDTNKPISGKEDVNYKLPSAQISLQVSCVIIENHLSFEVGPLIQVNGKLNLDNEKNNRYQEPPCLRKISLIFLNLICTRCWIDCRSASF